MRQKKYKLELWRKITHFVSIICFLLCSIAIFLVACTTSSPPLPTRVSAVEIPSLEPSVQPLPPTLTSIAAPSATPGATLTQTIPDVQSTPTNTLTPPPTPIHYTIQQGDTLSSIADAHQVDLTLLLETNELSPDNLIMPGEILIIPSQLTDSIELPVHFVKPGDTLADIAAQYGLMVDTLLEANSDLTPETLLPGQAVLLPILGEYHYTVAGDSLIALVVRYEVSIDDLISANLDILDPANPDFLPVNALIKIPQEQIVDGYDCSPLPPRSEVLSYIIQNNEKLFCLSSKFGVDITTLYEANPHLKGKDAVQNGVTILVPPMDGALYEVTADDEVYNVRLQNILSWYGVTRFDSIVDWQFNEVKDPLVTGQKLFIQDADLMAGPFTVAEIAAPTPALNPTVVSINTIQPPITTPGSSQPPITTPGSNEASPVVEVQPPSGEPPPGGLRPNSNPWSGEMTVFDTGFCGEIADGSGWSGTLFWPVDSRQIREGRGFRPGHSALDIEIALDSPVYAAESGLVLWAGFSRWGGGNTVVLAHGNGYQTYYHHLETVNVGCDQFVTQGTLIGTVGLTGASNFPHLHFSVRRNGFNFDPFIWLP